MPLSSAIATLSSSSLTPTAMELEWRPARLMIRFESVEAAVEQQAREAIGLVAGHGAATVLSGDDESELWARAGRWDEPGAVVKLSTRPTVLVPTLGWLQDACDKHDLQLAAAGRAGLGVVDVWLRGPAEGQARVIAQLRERLPVGEGSAVIRRGDAVLRRQVDPWGPVGDSLR